MCNLYSITTNQAAIIALFRVINRYVGNLAPMPGVFPDYPAPVVRNSGGELEMTMMRWSVRREREEAWRSRCPNRVAGRSVAVSTG
jgi:putative SOS response-associated peptidase YedK